MRIRLPRTAKVPAIALGSLAVFLVLSVFSAVQAVGNLSADTRGDSTTSSRYVNAVTYYDIEPGDQVVLFIPAPTSVYAAAPYARILFVEGGEGDAAKTGRLPEHILFETRFQPSTPSQREAHYGDYPYIETRFTRPGIYDGKPHTAGLNGDLHDAIDLMVLVQRPAGMSDSAWATVVESASHIDIMQPFPPVPTVIVARQPWVALQYVWYVGMAISTAVAVLGVVGFVRHRPVKVVEPGSDLSDLVAIQQTALGFLHTLRATMATAGAILAAGGLAGLIALNAGLGLGDGPYSPMEDIELERDVIVRSFDPWLLLTMGLGFVVYVLSLTVWFVQYRRISREYKRWTSTPNPLDA